MVRIKERYLLVNILYPPNPSKTGTASLPDFVVQHQPTVDKLTPQALLRAIKAEVAVLYGDYGSGALEGNLLVKYLSLATSTFILRCPREHYQLLWSALTFMDRIPVKDGRPCIFRVVRVSGTIRKAEEEAIRQARRLILAAKEQTAGAAGASPSARLTNTTHEQDQAMLDIADESSDDAMDEQDG